MDASKSQRDTVERLAKEFLERRRRGESPELVEYTVKYPDLAGEILAVFPTLDLLDDASPAPADLSNVHNQFISYAKPSRIGDYRIICEIGRGGMGVVYEAEQQSLGRHVALKVIPPHVSSDEISLERFRREARAAAKLHHSNIVPVFEVGQDGSACYYAMQFIQGEGLDAVLRELRRLRSDDLVPQELTKADSEPLSVALSLCSGKFYGSKSSSNANGQTVDLTVADPLPGQDDGTSASGDNWTVQGSLSKDNTTADRKNDDSNSDSDRGHHDLSSVESPNRHYYQSVARIGQQTSDALRYAHSRGVIHRDIKPSNLLLDANGVVWITDFGLAKTDDDGLTRTGDILGTMRYMSPERFQGECDARGDVYALGITLYELLVLQPAFQSSDRLELVEMISKVEPRRLREIDPRIPRDLETIVLKSIAKDPKCRYPTAEALSEDLRRFIEDEPILARRASMPEKLVRWARRNQGIAASLATIAVLLVLFAAGAIYAAFEYESLAADANEDRILAEEARQKSEKAEDEAKQAREQAESRLYANRIALAERAMGANDVASANRFLDTCIAKPGEPDRRSWEWYFLKGFTRGDLFTLPSHNGRFTAAKFSPDGGILATSNLRGEIKIWDALTGREIRSLGFKRLSASGGGKQSDHASHVGAVLDITFDSKGQLLASAGFDKRVKIWDLATGKVILNVNGPTSCSQVMFSPDSQQIFAIFRKSNLAGIFLAPGRASAQDRSRDVLQVYAVADGTLNYELRGSFRSIALGSDGAQFATVDHRGTIEMRQTADGLTIDLPLELPELATNVVFSYEPPWGISSHDDGTIRLWDADTGALADVLREHQGAVRALTVAPSAIASAGSDGKVMLWSLTESGRVSSILRGHTTAVNKLAFSADATRLVSIGSNAVKVWDLTRKPEGVTIGSQDWLGNLRNFVFTNDGTELVTFNPISGDLTRWDTINAQKLQTHFLPNSLQTPPIGGQPVWNLFSANGKRLATRDQNDDQAVKIFNVVSGKLQTTLRTDAGSSARGAISDDGRRVATYCRGTEKISIWDAESGLELQSLSVGSLSEEQQKRIDLATFESQRASDRRSAPIIDALAWRILSDAEHYADYLPRAVQLAKQTVELDPENAGYWTTLGVAQYRLGKLAEATEALQMSVDLHGGSAMAFLYQAMIYGKLGQLDQAREAYRQGDEWIRDTKSTEASLQLLRYEAASFLGIKLKAPVDRAADDETEDQQAVRCMAFSHDGTFLAVGYMHGAFCRVFDLEDRHEVATFGQRFGSIVDVEFDQEGTNVATLTGTRARGPRGHNRRLPNQGSRQIRLYQLATGTERWAMSTSDRVTSIAFSPDGRRLAAAGGTGGIQLWDTESGLEVLVLERMENAGLRRFVPAQIKFDASGRRLAANNASGSIQVWEVRDSEGAHRRIKASYYQSLIAQLRRVQNTRRMPRNFPHKINVGRLVDEAQLVAVLSERARAYARMLQWNQAYKDLKRATELSPQDEDLAQDRDFSLKMVHSVAMVPAGSNWRWLHPTDGVDPATNEPDFHTTFSHVWYDDAHWNSGKDGIGPEAGFGYGDKVSTEFEIPMNPSDRKTVYFRHTFTTDQAIGGLILSLQRDDGIIAYIDGIEVVRDNVGDGREAYDLWAERIVMGAAEKELHHYPLSTIIQPGKHVLAISLHNRTRSSSDLRLAEVSLIGSPYQPRPPEPPDSSELPDSKE